MSGCYPGVDSIWFCEESSVIQTSTSFGFSITNFCYQVTMYIWEWSIWLTPTKFSQQKQGGSFFQDSNGRHAWKTCILRSLLGQKQKSALLCTFLIAGGVQCLALEQQVWVLTVIILQVSHSLLWFWSIYGVFSQNFICNLRSLSVMLDRNFLDLLNSSLTGNE